MNRTHSIPAILNSIWQEGTGPHVFMPTQKRPGRSWRASTPIRYPIQDVPPQEWGFDMYFSPLTFTAQEISATTVAPGSVLFADLDEGDPWFINPTILWETSPGSLQAIWFTTRVMASAEQADLNKRLTYATRADRGGWGAAKVLRVPQTLNFKRAYMDGDSLSVPVGKVLHVDYDLRWSPELFESLCPPVEGTTVSEAMPPGEPPVPSWEGIPIGIVALFTMRWDDRSKRCWQVAQAFAKRGLPIERAWAHLWHAPFNKYTERPEVLWDTILRAYAEV